MIQLTTPLVESGDNFPSVDDACVALDSVTTNIYAQTITLVFVYGNKVNGVFVPDASQPPALTITANMSVNPPIWDAFNAQGFNTGGTLTGTSGTPVANMIAAIVAQQPAIEGFVSVAGGLLPGTVVAG